MSTAAISSLSNSGTGAASNTESKFDQYRRQDLTALGQALKSGNLNLAQAAFSAANSLQSSNGSGPFPRLAGATAAFQAIGEALQNGDIAGAQAAGKQVIADGEKALTAIKVSNVIQEVTPPPSITSTTVAATTSTPSSAASEDQTLLASATRSINLQA